MFGFSNLFNAILMSLDIKAMPLISKTANHQRSIVYVNDSKYDIDGIYVLIQHGIVVKRK